MASLNRVLRPTQSPEYLLQHREPLRLPPAQDRVGHSFRLEPEEEFHVLRRERHVHLHVVLLGAGRHRIGMAHEPAVLHVPLVGGPEVPVLVVPVLELVEPRPQRLHLGGLRPAQFVEEDVPLPEPVALPVPHRDQLLLGVVDLLQDRHFGGQVTGAEGGRPLVDHVLEEVRDTVQPLRLQHRPDANPKVGRDPRRPMILDEQDREAVVEHMLLDLERRSLRVRRRLPREGADRAHRNDEEQGSHDCGPLNPW